MGLMGFLGACSKQRFKYSIVSFVAMIGLAFKMKPTSRLKWRTEECWTFVFAMLYLSLDWKTSVGFHRRQITAE